MRTSKRIVVAITAGLLGLLLGVVAPALACEPNAQVSLSASEGAGGTTLQVTGTGFAPPSGAQPVELRWNSQATPAVATVDGPAFSTTVTVPPTRGVHLLIVSQRSSSSVNHLARLSRTFEVTSDAPQPAPAPAATPPPGYRMVASDGGIFAFGAARFHGSMGGRPLRKPIVGMAPTASGQGYWLVASDGGIFAFGDAGFFGSTGGTSVSLPIVGMARTQSGLGYWLVSSGGDVYPFGDAVFYGSPAHHRGAASIVGMTKLDEHVYVLAAADAFVHAFAAPGHQADGTPSSTTQVRLAKPIVGIAESSPGGYWLVAADGGVMTYGSAGFFGSTGGLALRRPVVGMAANPSGGYWLAGSDGGIFAFGNAPFLGSTGGVALAQPVVGVSATSG